VRATEIIRNILDENLYKYIYKYSTTTDDIYIIDIGEKIIIQQPKNDIINILIKIPIFLLVAKEFVGNVLGIGKKIIK
jgi:hypothetical protein